MKKKVLAGALILLLAACSPTLTIKQDGLLTATNYAIVQGQNSYVPKPLISIGFADSIVKLAESLGSKVLSTEASVVIPAPAPTPTPSPVTPAPTPVPVPLPVPTPLPDPEGDQPVATAEIIIADMDLIPGQMRAAGLGPGSDNAMYYALAFVYAFGPGGPMPDDGAGSLAVLNTQQEAIYSWFNDLVNRAKNTLKTNPKARVTIIANDARDRCGFRLGPPIAERLKDFSSRVTMGEIFPEDQY